MTQQWKYPEPQVNKCMHLNKVCYHLPLYICRYLDCHSISGAVGKSELLQCVYIVLFVLNSRCLSLIFIGPWLCPCLRRSSFPTSLYWACTCDLLRSMACAQKWHALDLSRSIHGIMGLRQGSFSCVQDQHIPERAAA